MDSFGKVVKAGLAKAYTAGQEQLQQHVGRRRNQELSGEPSIGQYSVPPTNTYYAGPTSAAAGQAIGHYAPSPPQNTNSQSAYAYQANYTPYFPPPPSHPGQQGAQDPYNHLPAPTNVGYGSSSVPGHINHTSCPIPPAYNTARPSHYQQQPSSYNARQSLEGKIFAPDSSLPVYAGQTSHPRVAQAACHSQTSASHETQCPLPQTLPSRDFTPPAPLSPAAASTSNHHQPAVASLEPRLTPSVSAPVPPQWVSHDSEQAGATQYAAHPYHPLPPPPASQRPQHPQTSPGLPISASAFAIQEQERKSSVAPPLPPPLYPSLAGPSRGPSQADCASPAAQDANGKPNDSFAELSAQMRNLDVRTEIPNGPPLQSAASLPNQLRAQQPVPMKATGAPNDIVRFCSEDRIVNYSLYWYHHAALPECLVCTRCHAEHIAGTSLAAEFRRVQQPDGSASTCGFWYPRIKDTLWPLAVRSNSTEKLLAFMRRRLAIPPCKGLVPVTGAEGIKWFGMAANDIDGFIACESCYEDRVMGTSFEARFSPYQKQDADQEWMCDMCVPYMSRAVAEMSKRNDWLGFVAGSARRLGLPSCEGHEVQSKTLNWYVPHRKIENMQICETCYMDKLAITPFEAEFQLHEASSGFEAFVEQISEAWTCMLSDSIMSIHFALDNAIDQRDYTVFWNAARTICSLVPCTANGIIRGNWWTLNGGCDGLSVCEACNAGILKTSGIDKFFEPVERDRQATIVCNLCIASPRFGQFLNKYAEALDKGVFSYYADHVKRFAGVQACPGIKNRDKARWWGYPEALFCEECYLSFVADTPLANHLMVKGVYDKRILICQIWSPRMRTMFLQVCKAGLPGSPESNAALDEFRAFADRRLLIYAQTVPRIEYIQQMKQIKMLTAMHQGGLSLMYQGMNSRAVLSGLTDDRWHGNSSIGWYETENGVTAARMRNNMQAGMADANRSDDWMEIAQLSSMWNEVE